jgi:hypothetical protein
MDYSSMLSYLQNLLTTQQGTNASQFSQNLGFNQQQLAQQGNQFNANLAAQQAMQQVGIQGQIAVQAPQLQTQKDINSANNANSLALQTAPLAEQNKEFTTTSGQTQQQIDLAKQLQMWQQQMALNNMNYSRSLPAQMAAEQAAIAPIYAQARVAAAAKAAQPQPGLVTSQGFYPDNSPSFMRAMNSVI